MKEWSDFRWMVRTMAKDSGVTIVSIARHLGISRGKLIKLCRTVHQKNRLNSLLKHWDALDVTW